MFCTHPQFSGKKYNASIRYIVSDKKGNVANDATWELHKLAGDIEHEEVLSQSGVGQ